MSSITPEEAEVFAWRERRDYEVYKALSEREKDPAFREILRNLMNQEHSDFNFWSRFTSKKEYKVSPWIIVCYVLMRKVFGLVFTAKFLERGERNTIKIYASVLRRMDENLKSDFEAIIAHEREHEKRFITSVKEGRLDFIGNIVLGLNDGLIELTGALVGFSFALSDNKLVAFTGLITGIAATLSMASSAYMQAKYDNEKEPLRAASYTGGAYLIVVILLVIPFFVFASNIVALSIMGTVTLAIIALVTWFGSVIFDRSFLREFSQMAMISIGVSCVTFFLGLLFRAAFGVSIQ